MNENVDKENIEYYDIYIVSLLYKPTLQYSIKTNELKLRRHFIMAYFSSIDKIQYEGPESKNPFAFRHYNPDEVILGKTMKEHMRFSVAY